MQTQSSYGRKITKFSHQEIIKICKFNLNWSNFQNYILVKIFPHNMEEYPQYPQQTCATFASYELKIEIIIFIFPFYTWPISWRVR